MNEEKPTIIYTLTDESPLLAACSLLPIIRTFAAPAGIHIKKSDISVSARILSEFSDHLAPEQRVEDCLASLERLTQEPDTNIIKLPNISASVPQLKAAIAELQQNGHAVPDYPEEASSAEEVSIRERYSKVLGSAVNPVLREGNSDRRAPAAVKRYARKHPHAMGEWSPASRTHVSHMRSGDFYHSEKCMTMDKSCDVKMDLLTRYGEVIVLKEKTPLLQGEIIDSMFMSKKALCQFIEDQLQDAHDTGVMFSLHVKATMMKVSHPIVFGHAVKVFYKDLFAKHGDLFERLGVNANNGISSVYEKIQTLPGSVREEIEADIHSCYQTRPVLAMVDPRKGISNLHAPNDVIVDASMPAMIREGGKMWGPDGKLQDTKAVMPESTYARIYQEMINFCKTNGAGGTAPKLVQQLLEENHLSWDSLGEFLALSVSLDTVGRKTGNRKAAILARTLDEATGKLLDNDKSPSPKTGQMDNRGSHFYLAMYWAQALAEQSEDAELQAYFTTLAKSLTDKEQQIIDELSSVQGEPVDLGGYFIAAPEKTKTVMRPSATFNEVLQAAQR